MSPLFQSPISYDSAINDLHKDIEADPYNRILYWKLSILYLLSKQEDDAQMVWMSVLSNAVTDQELDTWTQELSIYIENEADRLLSQEMVDESSLLYSCAYQVLPTSLPILLKLIQVTIDKGEVDDLQEYLETASHISQSTSLPSDDVSLIVEVMKKVLEDIPLFPGVDKFIASLVPHVKDKLILMKILLPNAIRIAYSLRGYSTAVSISEAYLLQDPTNYEFLGHLAGFHQGAENYEQGISVSKQHLSLASNTAERVFSSHLVLKSLLAAGGYWCESVVAAKEHVQLLSSLTGANTNSLHSVLNLRLFTSTYYLPYLTDGWSNRQLINQVTKLCQDNVRRYAGVIDHTLNNLVKYSGNKLRVGYLSHCMSQHSVGWLARWLIHNHNSENVEVYGYFINSLPYDSLHQWYCKQFSVTRFLESEFSYDTIRFAHQIKQDEINILIDLDSITLDLSCEILAMKPAPIQVTWLGWDAIGMDSIDYFIADPYVLPEHAQDYYTEKIWRLPETYLAVDGFEVAVPTLSRSSLNLPDDAITFLTAQRGYKRHRDTAVLQMKIIAGVPDGYLLIKGFADDQAIQNFFYEIADEVGVDRDRLRFLPSDPSEAVHRANLRIADVVLDTYPYNGATTTMETLWMEVPIVTRVGEQFAARNSYTMIINAGIIEGIAWSAEEYIEWGIKLGTDAKLRQEISWKLRDSKKTSPLWDGKKFARQMEDAYFEMWKIYEKSIIPC